MAEYSPENYLASLLTTPQQEAEHLRASRSRQRVLAFADALRHIGNIYNTSKGAPAQQFNDPVTQERNTYKQEKLLRDANNMKYFTYQQAKRTQDLAAQKYQLAAQKSQWDMLNGAAKLQLEQQKYALQKELGQARLASDQARVREIEARINRINTLLPGEVKEQEASIRQKNASANASSASAALNNAKRENPRMFAGSKGAYHNVYKRDENGRLIEVTSTPLGEISGGSLLPNNQNGGSLLPQ